MEICIFIYVSKWKELRIITCTEMELGNKSRFSQIVTSQILVLPFT